MKYLLVIVISIVLSAFPTYATNTCDVVSAVDCVGVNASGNGGGIHTSAYGRDLSYTTSSYYSGQRATYRAVMPGLTALTAGSMVGSICGASQRVVRVLRVGIEGTIVTTAVRVQVLYELSSIPNGGTLTNLARVPFDTKNNGIEKISLAQFYTNGTGPNTAICCIGSSLITLPITGTIAATDKLDGGEANYESMGIEAIPIVLRGTQQCLTVFVLGLASPSFNIAFTWTEE